LDIDNEISEACLIAIENMVRKCPNEAKPTLNSVFKLTSDKMAYDPNYHYNDDDDIEMANDDDEGGWGSDYFDDDQDDDDDTAWKVRKASIKIIDAVVTCCQSELSVNDYWLKYADNLSKRFIERDDNVKLDLLKTFQNLINTAIIKDNDYLNPNNKRVHPFASKAHELYP
jgi:cullin-associated NEDD8-dissociated protein 1